MDKLTKKQRKQRAKRGWCDEDAWNAFSHLSRVGEGMVGRLRVGGARHPGDLTDVEWSTILCDIEVGFRALGRMVDEWDDAALAELDARWRKACVLLAEWGPHLWD